MKNTFFIFFMMTLFALSSERIKEISGIILDYETKEPIANVEINLLNDKFKIFKKIKSNDKGNFKIKIDSNQTIKYISFVKKYYKIELLPFDKKNYIIYLQKSKVRDGYGSASKSVTDRLESSGFSMPTSRDVLHSTYDNKSINYNHYGAIKGKLTAGEINDYSKWILWNDLTNEEFEQYSKIYKLNAKHRVTALIKNKFEQPIYNANVILKNGENVLWKSITDNTGKAELWIEEINNLNLSNLHLEIIYKDKLINYEKPKLFENGINNFVIETDCLQANSIDIAFVVDATGSMQDEIDYLKADLLSIINSVKDTLQNLKINLGSVFYRDFDDEYLTRTFNLTNDILKTIIFINEQNADGGGDYPEAVNKGLFEAINKLSWNKESISKIIFLILDAPPHSDIQTIDEINNLIKKASENGIKIIPVACSGINKETEYFLRNMALLTNGTYTFLTNHSGIGNHHIEPSTDKYDVETFNELIKRLIIQYSTLPECYYSEYKDNIKSGDIILKRPDFNDKDKDITVRLYPNPSTGFINLELFNKIDELFVTDNTGKIVLRLSNLDNNQNLIDISFLPNGIYYLMLQIDGKIYKEKFLLMR